MAPTVQRPRARSSVVGWGRAVKPLNRVAALKLMALFFPMLQLEGVALRIASIKALHARPVDRTPRVESVLLGAQIVGYLSVVFLVLPPGRAVALITMADGHTSASASPTSATSDVAIRSC